MTEHSAESVAPERRYVLRLEAENTMLRKLVDDAINGCSPEWLIDGLALIDGSKEV